jgi:protoporphyrinogen/coproporphyrinogen III oxidase
MKNKIVILGAGISGLATAYLLKQKGYDVTVLEKKSEVGGSIETFRENGFLFDRGPNSALETTPLIAKFVEELDLKDQFVYANKAGNKRYILRNNTLHALPMSPQAFLKTKLFSTKAKLRLFAEPFIGKSNDGYYQSIAEFVTRRLGREFLDYAINPFVAGVYAGNPESLSVKSAFPKLYALEEKYGGLIVGTVKSIRERKLRAEKSKQSAKMLSFKDGMIVLPQAIAKYLGDNLLLQAEVKKIEKDVNRYMIMCLHKDENITISADVIISTVPSFIAADLIGDFDEGLKKHLLDIYYPPVLVQCLAYKREDIKRPLDGFGFLIPSKEKKSFLGAIWNSVIFPNRSSEDTASFTLFIGGARDPEIFSLDKELLFMKVRGEFETLMKITDDPIYSSYKFWPKAIPQYNIGYIEHENYFDEFEKKFPGIILSGNYRGGISVGDCIKNSELVAKKLIY